VTFADDRSLRGNVFDTIPRDSLTRTVYNSLRVALMEGRFWPGHRFKIRELAATMNVSETPIREALMQLVRARALELLDNRSIIVAHISFQQYSELRTIRLYLEGLAAEHATLRMSATGILQMEAFHDELIAAERDGRWSDAVRTNWQFHHQLSEAAEMPELLAILDDIWIRNGPLLNFQYPNARPAYPGEHEHLRVLDNLRKRNPSGVRDAIQNDMIQGGSALMKVLEAKSDTRNMLSEIVR
jgi:DNA-binding GntR family transcriptional regulator